MTDAFIKQFTEQSLSRIDENTQKLTACLHEIEEIDLWKLPNDNSNSIANLILHLCGNIRQYAISGLGETEDRRERNKEFSAKNGATKSSLLHKLTTTIAEATHIIKNTEESKWTKIYSVQGFNLSGIGIVIHITEHYSYHTGQIVFWTKQLKNKDLQFYAGIDLNVKNGIT